MISPTAERVLTRTLHAAPVRVDQQIESTETSRPRTGGQHPERAGSTLLNLVRRYLPASSSAFASLADQRHNGDLPPFEPDVLQATLAHDALLRSRQLRDVRHALRSSDSMRANVETLVGVLSTFEDPPPLLRELSARLLQEQMADDEGYVSDESEGARSSGPDMSSNDLLDEIFALMERLDKEWLSRFSDILGNYVNMFNKLTDAMEKLSGAIKDTDKDGNLIVNFDELNKALSDLHWEMATGDGLGGDFASEAEAKAFLDELRVEDLTVKQKADGTWELAVDPRLIERLRDMFPSGQKKMSPAAHAALMSAKDSLMERFNHLNRVLPDKYQRQLQEWDTVVKTLSGTIDSMAETNKLIMQNMA